MANELVYEICHMQQKIEEQQVEIGRLRAALIDCGRQAGCLLADEVSTDFLMGVPDELRAKLSVCKEKSK